MNFGLVWLAFSCNAARGAGEDANVDEAGSKSTRMPIATLPLFNDKLYIINSITLISAALRCRNLSFDPFIIMFSESALATSKQDLQRLRDPASLHGWTSPFYPSMSGEPLRGVVGAALKRIAAERNGMAVGGGLCAVPGVGNWLREVVSLAIMEGLYGSQNPLTLGRLPDAWCVSPP